MNRPRTLIARLEYDPTNDKAAQLALYRTEKDLADGCDCAILELNSEQLTKLAIHVSMQSFNIDSGEFDEQ